MAAWSPAAVGAPARLDAHQLDGRVVDQGIEHAGGVAAAADAGHDQLRQAAQLFEALRPRLAADDRLEIADDAGEGMRPDHRAETIVRRVDGTHPIAEGLVHGVAEGAGAAA